MYIISLTKNFKMAFYYCSFLIGFSYMDDIFSLHLGLIEITYYEMNENE
jgi:hypothetical protein